MVWIYCWLISYFEPKAIKEVTCSKDLGVKFDNDSGFKTHIKAIIAKCKQICGDILKTFSQKRGDQCLCF